MAVQSNGDIYMWNGSDVPVYGDQLTDYMSLLGQVADRNNAWSAEQAMKQMDFQERMSNTSHQREIADLKASGLNPILSAQQGATSPSGAMANADGSIVQALGSVLTKILDIQSDNAKANLISSAKGNGSGSYGSGNYYSESSGNVVSDNKELWIVALMAMTGKSYNECKKMVDASGTIIEKYGDPITQGIKDIANKFGLGDGSAKTNANAGSSSGSSSGSGIGNYISNTVRVWNEGLDKVSGALAGAIESVQNAVKKATSAVKQSTSTTTKNANKTATASAVSIVQKAINKVKNLFKK